MNRCNRSVTFTRPVALIDFGTQNTFRTPGRPGSRTVRGVVTGVVGRVIGRVGRVIRVEGAVYPAIQNLMLAARGLGLGTTLNSVHRENEQPFKDLDGGGLACSIRSEKTKAFPALDFEAQPAKGFDFAVIGLAQVAALDGSRHAKILT